MTPCCPGVEESLPQEPADDPASHSLGGRREVGRRDGPGRQERDADLVRPEQSVGDARMKVDVPVEGGAKTVEEGDGAETWAEGWTGSGVMHGADRVVEQPLDLGEEDPGESGDGCGPVGEEAPQPLGHRDHPLPDRHRRDDAVGKMRRRLGHVAARAGWADAPALAGEGHEKPVTAASAASAGEAEAEDAAAEILPQLPLDVCRDGPLAEAASGEPALQVPADEPMKRRLLGTTAFVAIHSPWPPRTSMEARSRPRCAERDHEPIRRRESSR